jgi:serine/threonine-protein kinase
MPLQPGEIVGGYKIIGQLGQGGMATVYKALHSELDRYVAIKVMHQAHLADPNFTERFRREAKIIAKLEHPNIVPVYDYSEHKGEPYLVMKFIEGDTFRKQIVEGDFHETVRMLNAIADALAYAHQRGVIHRDIKPSNLIVDQDQRPYVTDFGLARLVQAGPSTLSQDMLVGTPHYMSPEQAQGSANISPSSDLYSLGVIYYELAVGRVPFTGTTPYAVVHDHIYTPLPMPSLQNPAVPALVEMVLIKALAKDPADRYGSTVELAAAFRQAVAESGFNGGQASISAPSPAARKPASVAPPASVYEGKTTTGPSIPAPVKAGATIKNVATQPMTPPAAQRSGWLWGGIAVIAVLFVIIAFLLIRRPRASETPLPTVAVLLPPTATRVTEIVPSPTPIVVTATPNRVPPPTNPPPPDQSNDRPQPSDRPNDRPQPPEGRPPDIKLYTVPELTRAQAQQVLNNNPDDPINRLALVRALWQANRMEEALRNLQDGLRNTDDPFSYLLTAASIAKQTGNNNIAIMIYVQSLNHAQLDPRAYAAVRALAGEALYQMALNPQGINVVELQRAAARAPEPDRTGFFDITLARLHLSLKNRRLAEGTLSRLSPEARQLAESQLVKAEIEQAQNNNDQAKSILRNILAQSEIPEWVKKRAADILKTLGA